MSIVTCARYGFCNSFFTKSLSDHLPFCLPHLACEEQTHFRSSLLSLRKIASANPSGKTISWRKTFLANHGLEDSYWRKDYRTFFFLSICLRSQWFITPSCHDHIRNDKCPNDSRRLMPFVASVPFWFLEGKYALENSSIVCRVPH